MQWITDCISVETTSANWTRRYCRIAEPTWSANMRFIGVVRRSISSEAKCSKVRVGYSVSRSYEWSRRLEYGERTSAFLTQLFHLKQLKQFVTFKTLKGRKILDGNIYMNLCLKSALRWYTTRAKNSLTHIYFLAQFSDECFKLYSGYVCVLEQLERNRSIFKMLIKYFHRKEHRHTHCFQLAAIGLDLR